MRKIVAAAAADSNIESAESKAAELLQKHPEINALIGLNEWTTLGVGAAIKKANAAGKIKTVGFDTNTVSVGMLETGEMGALIVQNPFAMGYLSVKTAAELKNGEQPGGGGDLYRRYRRKKGKYVRPRYSKNTFQL